MALLVSLCVGLDSVDMKILFGIFAVAALRLLPSIRAIMSSWTSLRYNSYAIDIIRDANIDTPAVVEDSTTERIEFTDKIAIKNLYFRFEDSQSDTLSNINFDIHKGEKIQPLAGSVCPKQGFYYHRRQGAYCRESSHVAELYRLCFAERLSY